MLSPDLLKLLILFFSIFLTAFFIFIYVLFFLFLLILED
jgi:hypothetical protein